jgi:hypothetical protein
MKTSTVWRRVATVGGGEEDVHRLATRGYVGGGEEDVHRLATHGYGGRYRMEPQRGER